MKAAVWMSLSPMVGIASFLNNRCGTRTAYNIVTIIKLVDIASVEIEEQVNEKITMYQAGALDDKMRSTHCSR